MSTVREAATVEDAATESRDGARRWAPFTFAVVACVAILLAADTPVTDIIKYAAYVTGAVALPGTLVYRALRRSPHTLVEDIAMGVAVGLTLEIGGWALFSALDLRGWLWTWPLAVIVPFAALPRLRRHWRPRGYHLVPSGWAWSVALITVFFTGYLFLVFLDRNPILPTDEGTRQYLDLAYQLSLAGEATHRVPPDLPQVAGEPLHYHWFAHAHMAIASMVGHIDLPVVALRLAIPALCAAAVVLTAVVGWRVSRRPYVGVVAAVLFWVLGEVNFTNPVTQPFGTQATFVIWHGMSMIHSWVLLIALIGVLASVLRKDGGYLLAALLMLGSSGSKASSLPVVLVALAVPGVILLATRRRVPWQIVAAGALAAGAQAFATAVLFRFQTYGLAFGPLENIRGYWQGAGLTVTLAVWVAFLVNMQLRLAGIGAVLWIRRGRLEPVQWFLLGGALAGPALYLTFSNIAAQYFTRAGFAFGVLVSAWGYVMVVDRARLSRDAAIGLGAAAAALAVVLSAIQIGYAAPAPPGTPDSPITRIVEWFALLALASLVGVVVWLVAEWRWPTMRGRLAVVMLTAVLVAGAPGLVMDAYQSLKAPNGGPYATIALPRSRVEAARWVRANSDPDDVLATNAHCLYGEGPGCDARSFWLSAYAERSVLVEGWGFAPRLHSAPTWAFWDPELFARNDEAMAAPTAAGLRELADRYRVRWLIVDRDVWPESPDLAALAIPRFDNGRLAVYELAR